jgi:DedD protein
VKQESSIGKIMDSRSQQSGTEYVLDNRKLIVGFLLFSVACGAFFAIGFMEGKRQCVQAPQPGAAPEANPSARQTNSPAASGSSPAADPQSSMRERLEWYKNVQGGGADKPSGAAESPEKAAAPAAKIVDVPPARPATKETPAADKAAAAKAPPASDTAAKKTPPPAGKAAKSSYTVQVGAFTQRHEADLKVDALKAKGFSSIVEEPKPPDQFFRVKVGRFDTRAEAVAMQRKLQKAGFICIIKTD